MNYCWEVDLEKEHGEGCNGEVKLELELRCSTIHMTDKGNGVMSVSVMLCCVMANGMDA